MSFQIILEVFFADKTKLSDPSQWRDNLEVALATKIVREKLTRTEMNEVQKEELASSTRKLNEELKQDKETRESFLQASELAQVAADLRFMLRQDAALTLLPACEEFRVALVRANEHVSSFAKGLGYLLSESKDPSQEVLNKPVMDILIAVGEHAELLGKTLSSLAPFPPSFLIRDNINPILDAAKRQGYMDIAKSRAAAFITLSKAGLLNDKTRRLVYEFDMFPKARAKEYAQSIVVLHDIADIDVIGKQYYPFLVEYDKPLCLAQGLAVVLKKEPREEGSEREVQSSFTAGLSSLLRLIAIDARWELIRENRSLINVFLIEIRAKEVEIARAFGGALSGCIASPLFSLNGNNLMDILEALRSTRKGVSLQDVADSCVRAFEKLHSDKHIENPDIRKLVCSAGIFADQCAQAVDILIKGGFEVKIICERLLTSPASFEDKFIETATSIVSLKEALQQYPRHGFDPFWILAARLTKNPKHAAAIGKGFAVLLTSDLTRKVEKDSLDSIVAAEEGACEKAREIVRDKIMENFKKIAELNQDKLGKLFCECILERKQDLMCKPFWREDWRDWLVNSALALEEEDRAALLWATSHLYYCVVQTAWHACESMSDQFKHILGMLPGTKGHEYPFARSITLLVNRISTVSCGCSAEGYSYPGVMAAIFSESSAVLALLQEEASRDSSESADLLSGLTVSGLEMISRGEFELTRDNLLLTKNAVPKEVKKDGSSYRSFVEDLMYLRVKGVLDIELAKRIRDSGKDAFSVAKTERESYDAKCALEKGNKLEVTTAGDWTLVGQVSKTEQASIDEAERKRREEEIAEEARMRASAKALCTPVVGSPARVVPPEEAKKLEASLRRAGHNVF